MARPKATLVDDTAVEDAYLETLSDIIENYKELIASDHPDADKLLGKATELFQIARRQHSLIAALRDKREGGK